MLVITIIIMIILAAAIILSLTNSGIIGNAKEASRVSDIATAKNVAAIASGEWELLNEKGTTGLANKKAYIEAALSGQGFTVGDKLAVTENGEVVAGNAANAIVNGLKIGDYVEYSPDTKTSTKYKTYDSVTSQEGTAFATETTLKWKYMGMDQQGNALLISDKPTDGKLYLESREGYLQGPNKLNDLCKEIYSSSSGEARSINVEDVNKVLGANLTPFYWNLDRVKTELPRSKKIGEIIKENIGLSLWYTKTPDGKDINNYLVNHYEYLGTEIKSNITEEYKLIFRDINSVTYISYWLASSSVDARFYGGYVDFRVRYIGRRSTVRCVFDQFFTAIKTVMRVVHTFLYVL